MRHLHFDATPGFDAKEAVFSFRQRCREEELGEKLHLIVLNDGTGVDGFEKQDSKSSIWNLRECLRGPIPKKGGIMPQVVLYWPGVATRGRHKLWKTLTGEELVGLVMEMFNILQLVYEEDDRISLIGFSRGAFAMRSLAILIRYLGLPSMTRMKADAVEAAPFALQVEMLRDLNDGFHPPAGKDLQDLLLRGRAVLEASALQRSRKPDIFAMILFDCVGFLWCEPRLLNPTTRPLPAAGLRLLPVLSSKSATHLPNFRFWGVDFTHIGSDVQHFFHAVALDENRRTFAQTQFKLGRHSKNKMRRQMWFGGSHNQIGRGRHAEPHELAWLPFFRVIAEMMTLKFDLDLRKAYKLLAADYPPAHPATHAWGEDPLQYSFILIPRFKRKAPTAKLEALVEEDESNSDDEFASDGDRPGLVPSDLIHPSAMLFIQQEKRGEKDASVLRQQIQNQSTMAVELLPLEKAVREVWPHTLEQISTLRHLIERASRGRLLDHVDLHLGTNYRPRTRSEKQAWQ